ncbi:MAG: YfdX family protein [Burkholderiales bacterium]|nr:YfdX family protein [Burkholderiales bacterium]MDR4517604.1 YfdX family protein [Nitrosomonas sp.]
MNKNTHVCSLLLTAALVLPGIVFATDASKSQPINEKTPIEQQREQTQTLVHKMMGHISMAQFALSLKLPDEASSHIEKAQDIESELTQQSPEFKINSAFKYGKVTYDESQTIKEHYVPVVDDILLVSDYEATFKHSKEKGMKETGAALVHVNVMLDLRQVKASLDRAMLDINNKDYVKAQNALAALFKGAIVDEVEIDDPRLAILGNLSLAKGFLNNGQYDKARFTLQYVQKRLNEAKNTRLSNLDQASVEALSIDLDKLQAELRKEDPTLTERISARFDQWKQTVKGWVHYN